MLLVGYAALFVVHHFAIAIEREPIFDVAAHAKHRHRFVRRAPTPPAARPAAARSRCGRADESRAWWRANFAECRRTAPRRKERAPAPPARSMVARRSRATPKPLVTTRISSAAPTAASDCGRERARRRHLRAVRHKPGQQQHGHGQDAAQRGVAQQNPAVQPRLPAAEKIISGEDGDGRNGGQECSRAAWIGRRRKRRWESAPTAPGTPERRRRAGWADRLAVAGVAQPPLGHRGQDAVDQRAHRDHRPGHDAPAPPPPGSTRTAARAGNGRWQSAPGCAPGRIRGKRWDSDAARQ